jgi:hypothetical protein
VNSHMNISKLRPRFFRGRVLGFVAPCQPPNAVLRMTKTAMPNRGMKTAHSTQMASRECSSSFGPQVEDGDPQSVDGVEQRTEEDEDLEEPVLIISFRKPPISPP